MIDSLVHAAIEGESTTPPAASQEGETWLVAQAAQAEWAGMDGQIAIYLGSSWKFVQPSDGMAVFDKSIGQIVVSNDGWKKAIEPAPVSGGSNIDVEARAAISDLIESLRNIGIFPRS